MSSSDMQYSILLRSLDRARWIIHIQREIARCVSGLCVVCIVITSLIDIRPQTVYPAGLETTSVAALSLDNIYPSQIGFLRKRRSGRLHYVRPNVISDLPVYLSREDSVAIARRGFEKKTIS